VQSADSAAAAAAALGYPVVAKIAVPGAHKTDIGGVRIGLADEAAVRRAFVEISALCSGLPMVLIQPMLPAATEVIIGAVQHDQFGPAVMVGAGGVLANLIADRAFRLAPLTVDDAQQMLGELRTAPLFDGYRAAPVISRAALSDLVVRVGTLADDLPDVAELDLNPVICRGEELMVVDARIRVGAAPRRADPMLRQLR
jgi:acyl-CoA synthetase (NDP forming)